MAARIRRELGQEVEMVRGHYGEFKVLVDGEQVVDGGALAFLGIMPSAREVLDTTREAIDPQTQDHKTT